jgi:ribonuclease Z
MTFSLTILGSASAMPIRTHFPTSQLLNIHEQYFLVDCGEGTQMQLKRYGFSLLKINHVFISHLHGDHLFGIFGLIATMSMLGRTTDLHIHAPALLDEILNSHLRYFGDRMTHKIVFHATNTSEPELTFENKALTVYTIPLKHRIPTAGFLFREKTPLRNVHKHFIVKYNLSISEIVKLKAGENIRLPDGELLTADEMTYQPYEPRTYAFCSDTMYCEKIIPQIQGIDLLYHEATYAGDRADLARETGHSTAEEAAKIAAAAEVKQLLLGHFSSRYTNYDLHLLESKAIFPNTELITEGKKVEIMLRKKE